MDRVMALHTKFFFWRILTAFSVDILAKIIVNLWVWGFPHFCNIHFQVGPLIFLTYSQNPCIFFISSPKMMRFFYTSLAVVFITHFSRNFSKNYRKFFGFEYYTRFRNILPQYGYLIFAVYSQIWHIFLFYRTERFMFLWTIPVAISTKIIVIFGFEYYTYFHNILPRFKSLMFAIYDWIRRIFSVLFVVNDDLCAFCQPF